MELDRLEDRIDVIRAQIQLGHHTIAAKESAGLIEFAYKEFYRRSLGSLRAEDRRRVFEAEEQIGGGVRSVEEFTFGQLVGLFTTSRFMDRWSKETGRTTRGLQMINVERLVSLRNQIVHEGDQVGRAEAELFFGCLQTVLETFGILSLEKAFEAPATSGPSDGRQATRLVDRSGQTGRASGYRWATAADQRRLQSQAASAERFDRGLLERALARLPDIDGLVAVDLGCADGAVTRTRLTQELGFGHVLAVDHEAEPIAAARAHGDEHIEYLELDLEAPQIVPSLERWLVDNDAGGFDVVLAAYTLHHLAGPIRLLRNMRHLLATGGAVIVRGFDDATMLQFPDIDDRVARVVELCAAQPDVSDRFNGRRLYHWLYRAGFRDIELSVSLRTTAGLSPDERHRLFVESFGFRRRYFVDANDPTATKARRDQRREVDELLADLEVDMEDESGAFLELDIGAVAWA